LSFQSYVFFPVRSSYRPYDLSCWVWYVIWYIPCLLIFVVLYRVHRAEGLRSVAVVVTRQLCVIFNSSFLNMSKIKLLNPSLNHKWCLLLHEILHLRNGKTCSKGFRIQRKLFFIFYSRFYHLEEIISRDIVLASKSRNKLHYFLRTLSHKLIIYDASSICNSLKLNTYKAFFTVYKNERN
jgi:hypothetical protein